MRVWALFINARAVTGRRAQRWGGDRKFLSACTSRPLHRRCCSRMTCAQGTESFVDCWWPRWGSRRRAGEREGRPCGAGTVRVGRRKVRSKVEAGAGRGRIEIAFRDADTGRKLGGGGWWSRRRRCSLHAS